MASKHRPVTAAPAAPEQAGAVVEPEKDCARHDKAPAETVPPHCGRTGGAGARAERPSEGSIRKSDGKAPQPGRSGIGPSAAAPHSEERSSK